MAGFDQRITNRTQAGIARGRVPQSVNGSTAAQGTARAQASAQGMQFFRGQVLHGEIIDLRNHQIQVQLSDSQVLAGTIADAMQLSIGEEASFQVTDATPSTVALKVISDQRALSGEVTIDKALEAAGLPKSDHNASAVRALLEQGLSIDKHSIQLLLRQSATFRGVSFQTLAAMTKYHLPMTEANVARLEAYQNQEHRIVSQLQQTAVELTDSLDTLLALGETAKADHLNQQALSLLLASDHSSTTGQAAELMNAPLASFALFDNDGLLSLLDTLDTLQFPPEQTAAIANGSASLGEVGSWLLSAADRLSADPQAVPGANGLAESTSAPAANISASAAADIVTANSADLAANQVSSATPQEESARSILTASQASAAEQMNGQTASTPATLFSALRSLFTGGNSSVHTAETSSGAESTIPPNTPPQHADTALAGAALSETIEHLPIQMQTPEIFALLGSYAALARSSSTVSAVLSKEQRVGLAASLRHKLPGTVLDKLKNGELTTAALLKLLLESDTSDGGKEGQAEDHAYLASKAYQELLHKQLMDRFSLTPEELTEPGVIEDYYDRLDQDFETLEQLTDTGAEGHSFQSTAAGVRDNIDFMKTLNHLFPYVQLPMKLSGQYTHAELYLYQDQQKTASATDAPVHVLLHLDMEQLGPLDIHLQLNQETASQSDLHAVFYLPDADSAKLTADHLSSLSAALGQKGIQLTARAEARKKESNLVQDLLFAEKNNSSMKRYTFDIRA